MSLTQTWALSRAWYDNRLESTFRGRGAAAAEAILRDVGLTSPFWLL